MDISNDSGVIDAMNTDRHIRVTMIISRFPPCVGGTERQAFLLSRELVRTGLDVTVVTQRYDPDLPQREVMDGVPVHRLGPIGTSPFSVGLFTLNSLRMIAKLKPDIVHAHMIASPAVIALASSAWTGARSIVKAACSGEYGDVATSRRTWLGHHKLRWAVRKMDRIICISQEIRKEMLSAGASPAGLVDIPNAVDTERFRPLAEGREKESLKSRLNLVPGRWILYAARLTRQKRPDVLIEAFRRCATQLADWRLLLLGDGPERPRLQALIAQGGLEDRVVVAGNVSHPEDYYRASDLFVLSSEAEGLPNSLMEAMASGLPCIASRIGGATDLLQEEQSGLLVPAGDAAALALAINRIAGNPLLARKMGDNARRRIEDLCALPTVARRYKDLYVELLKPGDIR